MKTELNRTHAVINKRNFGDIDNRSMGYVNSSHNSYLDCISEDWRKRSASTIVLISTNNETLACPEPHFDKLHLIFNKGFQLEFEFEPNEYFTNKVLTKRYYLGYELREDNPLSYDGPEVTSSEGWVD